MKKVSDIELDPAEQLHLLDELQNLLERQIELAHQGNIKDVELLSEHTDCLVRKIVEIGVLESPEFKDIPEQLSKLYKKLCLVLIAQKADIAERLSHVRKGKKTIETYHSNI